MIHFLKPRLAPQGKAPRFRPPLVVVVLLEVAAILSLLTLAAVMWGVLP